MVREIKYRLKADALFGGMMIVEIFVMILSILKSSGNMLP